MADLRRRLVILALPLLVAAAIPVQANSERAPPLPESVASLAPGLRAQGGGLLSFFGISVYDGWYWSDARGWPDAGPYALDLHYHRNLDGDKIAQRSVDEIAQLGYGTEAERSGWRAQLTRILPNVRRGDRLTGVTTDASAVRFFHNGVRIGEIAEPGFARAFFGIWLDPKTSQTDFRAKLLGAR
ncbi:MAG: chalcone isomerase family protein [Betaproteobacteria bacterium]|nr:chalcone isomerase family protein [Betaproteobacteria bacterium]